MKKIFCLLFLSVLGVSLFAQVIDKPVIKVEYDSVDMITEKILSARLEQQKKIAKIYNQDTNSIKERDVAKLLVQEYLLLQYAETLKIDIDDYQVEAQIRSHKDGISQQLGRQITQVEYEAFLKQYGLNLEDLKANFKRVAIIQKLVNDEKTEFIENYPKPVEKDVIRLFNLQVEAGRLNKPTYVQLSHIFLNTSEMRFDKMKETNAKALSILTKLKKGEAFTDLVIEYSEDKDTSTKEGQLGWTSIQDPRFLQLFGEDAALDIISLKKGGYSAVLESPMGFHIVKILDRVPGGIPKLSDTIAPQSKETFKDYFMQLLAQEGAEKAFMLAMEELYEELSKDTVITYYDKRLQ